MFVRQSNWPTELLCFEYSKSNRSDLLFICYLKSLKQQKQDSDSNIEFWTQVRLKRRKDIFQISHVCCSGCSGDMWYVICDLMFYTYVLIQKFACCELWIFEEFMWSVNSNQIWNVQCCLMPITIRALRTPNIHFIFHSPFHSYFIKHWSHQHSEVENFSFRANGVCTDVINHRIEQSI